LKETNTNFLLSLGQHGATIHPLWLSVAVQVQCVSLELVVCSDDEHTAVSREGTAPRILLEKYFDDGAFVFCVLRHILGHLSSLSSRTRVGEKANSKRDERDGWHSKD
jgi:hypothetical protein